MTKDRARSRKRDRLARSELDPTPGWGPALLTFGFMLVVIGVLRVLMKGAQFAWTDGLFVVLFAAVMALLAYFRPKLFE